MASETIGFIGIATLLLLIGLRIPIAIALITVSFCGIWAVLGLYPALGALKIVPYNFAASWQLSAVPMFLFMGFLAFHAGITRGLFDAAKVWLNRLPGGLAIGSVFGATGFAAVTGSSLACAAAMGRVAVPEMQRAGYSPALATGTVAAAGTIGALIPPSILFIIFGILAQQSVSKLFLGGAVVGLLTAASYVGTILLWSWLRPDAAPREATRYTMRQRLATLVDILPVIVLALAVFGGLFGGIFTPTEAASVGAGICLLIAIGKGTLTWENLKNSIMESLSSTAAIFMIAVGANLLTRFVALSGVGADLAEMVAPFTESPLLLIVGIVVVYLILGMFLEPMGAMLLTLPILLPIVKTAGFDMIWFGVLLAKLLEIGMITPPVGLNVFIIKSVVSDDIMLSTIFRGVMYFLLADIVIVAVIIAFPDLVTAVPQMLAR